MGDTETDGDPAVGEKWLGWDTDQGRRETGRRVRRRRQVEVEEEVVAEEEQELG